MNELAALTNEGDEDGGDGRLGEVVVVGDSCCAEDPEGEEASEKGEDSFRLEQAGSYRQQPRAERSLLEISRTPALVTWSSSCPSAVVVGGRGGDEGRRRREDEIRRASPRRTSSVQALALPKRF